MNIIRQIDILESCWIKSGSDVLKAVSLLLFIFLSFFFSLKIEFLFRFILSKLKPAKLFWHLGKLLNEKLRQFSSVLMCSFRLFLWSFERIKNKTKKKDNSLCFLFLYFCFYVNYFTRDIMFVFFVLITSRMTKTTYGIV